MRQGRRIRAAKSALDYAVRSATVPYVRLPGKVKRWGLPYLKWFQHWYISPIAAQWNSASTMQRNPATIQWGHDYHKSVISKKQKPNAPKWSQIPRKKKSGGMRPSR